MFWERALTRWIAQIRDQFNLPARLILWNGRQHDFGDFAAPQIVLQAKNVTALPYLLEPTLDNLGAAYVQGKIDVEGKLTDIIHFSYTLAQKTYSSSYRLLNWQRYFRHSRKVDKQAIKYHYDVSNEFYQLWLDKNMVYSCAYFENGTESLENAQLKKIDHILTKIQAHAGQTLLDIGCGWGALVIRAAQKFGMRCVGITLSQKQFELAQERVKAAKLTRQVEIRLQDYRDVTGQFDRITSVGMFEHVGQKNLPVYFAKIHKLLKDDGIAMNHGITSTELDGKARPFGGSAFINKYVFPHGELSPLFTVLESMQRSGFEVFDVENLRRHYVRTLNLWSENFERHAIMLKQLIDERKFRIWRIYLAGCAYAFERDDTSIYQIVCRKAGRTAQTLPYARRYMYENRLHKSATKKNLQPLSAEEAQTI